MNRAYTSLLLTITLFLSVATPALAQIDNSCKYPFTFGKADDSYFSFCLTKYGTLASLRGPQGSDHLDPINPVEGWILSDSGGNSIFNQINVLPGLGDITIPSSFPITVSEPKGPGTLPITFTYTTFANSVQGNVIVVSETVTASPSQKIVLFTMKTPQAFVSDDNHFASGPFVRLAALTVDGSTTNNFDHSLSTAFGLNRSGRGVSLAGDFIGNLFQSGSTSTQAGTASIGPVTGLAPGCSNRQPFSGQGAVCEIVQYSTAHAATEVFTYRIF